ncbi:MAG: multicopper oxidase domain-containing protein [Roseiflexaceae bacterium]
MFQHRFTRQQRPQLHAKEAIFFSRATSRPLVQWLLPVGLAAMAALFVWFIAGSDRLSAAAPASITLQPSPPISVDGGKFGLGVVGATQTYTHTVTNNSLLPQTATLTVTSHKGWAVSVSPASLALNPGASATAVVSMTIPGNALPGTLDVATLTATAGVAKASGKDSLLVETGKTLAIPALEMGQMVDGQRVYNLAARAAITQFRPGVNTPTWGYNTNTYLGPTLVVTKTEHVQIQVTNSLTEVTTVHWHGLHLPGKTDGGPHQEINVGETWKPSFTIINEAATAWYHPHPHGHDGGTAETATQVYRGLAGMIVVRDANSAALHVPKTYGVDDFPVVVQDRKFKANGGFDESKDAVGIRNGDSFLVNGTFAGTLNAPAQMVRFRVLNGANHRFLNFGFSDNRSFYQIASDNGFLNAPVQRSRFHMGPGERIEIIVDLSNAQGKTIHFVAYDAELGDTLVPEYTADDFDRSNFILFSINVTAPTANAVTSIPGTLNNITRYSVSDAVRIRTLRLTLPPAINNTPFDMETINITSTLDTQEVWSIVNQSNDPHPIHIHDSPFQIVKHLDPTGKEIPIPAYEMGWKDTVIVRAGERVDVIKDFSGFADPTGPFMYHCHILEHEGEGMMGQFVIIDGKSVYLSLVAR